MARCDANARGGNGIALHGGLYTAMGTFFVFSDYMKPAIRMAALMELPVKYVWTHDAFRVGEDGPTHDSVFKTKPFERISRTDSRGQFIVKGLSPGKYRAFALNDQNQNYIYDQKSEMVAFSERVLSTASKPDVRPDTIWHDSIHYDSIIWTPYTHFYPDDIVLLAFNSKVQDRFLLKTERPTLQQFSIYFTAPSDTLPRLTGLNFNADDAFIIDANERKDTLHYWIRDSLVYNIDTLNIQLDFYASDTLGQLVLNTDTLYLVPKLTKAKMEKEAKEKYDEWVKEYKQRLKDEKRAARKAEKEGTADVDADSIMEDKTSSEISEENSNKQEKKKRRKKDEKEEDVRNILIPMVKAALSEDAAALFDDNLRLLVNPTGKFVIGGPHGDTGLTGRKIIVDTYGGRASNGGGAFSGKDPSKVDRSAAYATRYIAKNMVAAGIADEMLIQVAYAIGVAEPVSIFVNTHGTACSDSPLLQGLSATEADAVIASKITELFDLRPSAIIKKFDLKNPIYEPTAAYGHFGRKPYAKSVKLIRDGKEIEKEIQFFGWEKLDAISKIRLAFGLK